MKTLSIIGCGNVGKTLGRLWHTRQAFQLQDILNRSAASAQSAVNFVGAGRAVGRYSDLRPADIYLLAVPDDQIARCCQALAETGKLSGASVVFHCSGALCSSELQAAATHGAATASVHPIRSFASPEQVVTAFAGTWCGVEGDQRALAVLRKGFTDIGAQLVAIDADAKILYHAAAVFASNYLVTLMDVARHAYEKAGVPPEAALALLGPLVRETSENIFRLGPEKALTGPIARGDMATVEKQYQAVAAWDKDYGDLYAQFSKLTVALASRR